MQLFFWLWGGEPNYGEPKRLQERERKRAEKAVKRIDPSSSRRWCVLYDHDMMIHYGNNDKSSVSTRKVDPTEQKI